jgi:ABC-2 type transport system permease protein
LSPSLAQILGFALLIVASILVHYSLMLTLSATCFWTVRAQGIVWGYYNLFNLARTPDAAFKGYFRVVFTFVLPMLLIANVPTKLIIEKLSSPWEMVLLLLMSLLLLFSSEAFWRYALKHYTSASS